MKKCKRKNNPLGGMYYIYIIPSTKRSATYKLVWKGYGETNPWGMFREAAWIHYDKRIALYVQKKDTLYELAQCWEGEIIYSE